ncbi:MAG: S41 family peptidase [Candidatus Spechtbacterales bacterium]|nr:S41 family peptidase [Candidatus Spechtbacterales bacterium]
MEEDKKQKRSTARFLTTFIIVALIFTAGFLIGQGTQTSDKGTGLNLEQIFNGKEEVEFSLIEDVWVLINEKYVAKEELDRRALIFGAIRGMVSELDDPYSVFFNKEETQQFLTSVSGQFEGVGIEISIKEDQLTVVSPLKNTPAHKAGIKAGDKIVAIDGQSTESITLEEAVSKIRGPKGTEVVLTVAREGVDGEIEIPIVRDKIEVPSVEWELIEGNVAYVELTHFSEITGRDFSETAQQILESPADRIVLDVRNNPGGFLDVSINIAGWFLEKGELVVTEELADDVSRKHTSPGPGSLKDLHVVVLQNEGSASAAEILAGALRDHLEADIVGEKSFGKGSVQSFEELPGSTALKLTVARWITPSGQYINDKGIEPTVQVEMPQDLEEGQDPQKERAIEIVQSL